MITKSVFSDFSVFFTVLCGVVFAFFLLEYIVFLFSDRHAGFIYMGENEVLPGRENEYESAYPRRGTVDYEIAKAEGDLPYQRRG